MAPREIANGAVRHWRARDDVYQVGQLLGMLAVGRAEEPITPRDIPKMPCDDDLKEIIQRCIGRRHKRFDTAAELIARLKAPLRGLREARVQSLVGKTIVFTGRLAITRERAMMAALRAGATVAGRVSAHTDIVVRGAPNPLQIAGRHGQKLIDVEMWRERGRNVRVIGGKQFLKLVRGSGCR
jgi:NAD-dependent DNA ligase